MKAKPYKYIKTEGRTGNMRSSIPCEPHEADYVELNMPGPMPCRHIPVIQKGSRDARKGPVWTWNGDVDKPTLKPSILTRGSRMLTDEEAEKVLKGERLNIPEEVCHTWVNDGNVQYLNDCTHEFAGQTLELMEVEE